MEFNHEVLLKSLHVCLRLPIMIFDNGFNLIEEYRSDRTTSFFYNYRAMLEGTIHEKKIFYFITGQFNELFLIYLNKDRYYLFGPFRGNIIDQDFFQLKMERQRISFEHQRQLYDSLERLPLYSLGDIRDILILVHYIFTGNIEDLLHKPIYDYTDSLAKEIELTKVDDIVSQNYNPELYLYLYENKF